ncbi:J domain-containing protein [Elioraea thermophila]|uniref:J domain-containing protein n=1 Tax=Elioraea thermophila TaxID=2185104 RepID=UPI000DF33C46|nr:J domain-containing protein [Elioraea thermophila]
MRSTAARTRRYYVPDPRAEAEPRVCDSPGCTEPGAFRAPKSREALDQYWWFCLEHVREYNRAWDYYKGMTPAQIEAELRRDTTWRRPSWPLGRLGALDEALADPLGLLARRRTRPTPPAEEAPPALRRPLAVLGLGWPVAREDVKKRYKALALAHHPDRHGGSPEAEEKLKEINAAYAAVMRALKPAQG